MRHGATHARRRVELTDEPTRRRHGAMHAERVEGARRAWGEQRITSPTHTQRCPLLPPGVPCARARCVRPYFPSLPKKHVRSPRRHGLLHSKYAWLTFSRTVFAHIFSLFLFFYSLTDIHTYATSPRVCRDINSRKPARGPPLLRRVLSFVTAQAQLMFRDSHSTYAHGTPTITHNHSQYVTCHISGTPAPP